MRGLTASGEIAGGDGIKASANMWALLSDNDPGHSEAAAVKQRLDGEKAKGKGLTAEARREAAASAESKSNVVGGDTARYDREEKQARKERNKKQKPPPAANGDKQGPKERNKERKKPPATANGETVLTAGDRQNQMKKGPA